MFFFAQKAIEFACGDFKNSDKYYLPVLYSTSLQVSTKASHLAQLLKLILIGVVKNETAIQAEIFSHKFVSIFDKIFEEEKF